MHNQTTVLDTLMEHTLPARSKHDARRQKRLRWQDAVEVVGTTRIENDQRKFRRLREQISVEREKMKRKRTRLVNTSKLHHPAIERYESEKNTKRTTV